MTRNDAEARLKRLYDAIESGIADLGDDSLKERIAELRALKAQAQADAERAAIALEEGIGAEITLGQAPFLRGRRSSAATRPGWWLSPRPSARARPAGRGRRGSDHGIAEQSVADISRRRRRSLGWGGAQLCTEVADRVGFEPT
jgi:hypothetical protein